MSKLEYIPDPHNHKLTSGRDVSLRYNRCIVEHNGTVGYLAMSDNASKWQHILFKKFNPSTQSFAQRGVFVDATKGFVENLNLGYYDESEDKNHRLYPIVRVERTASRRYRQGCSNESCLVQRHNPPNYSSDDHYYRASETAICLSHIFKLSDEEIVRRINHIQTQEFVDEVYKSCKYFDCRVETGYALSSRIAIGQTVSWDKKPAPFTKVNVYIDGEKIGDYDFNTQHLQVTFDGMFSVYQDILMEVNLI